MNYTELLERIATAIEKQRTIVPIFVFIPQNVPPDKIREMAKHVSEELRRAGFDVPRKVE